jgi:CRISPR/Cas system-associated exonuclease Cas4 (RecB family)
MASLLDLCDQTTTTGRDYLSFSAVSTFQSCPLKYEFRYLRRLPEECIAASLVFGSAIHSAVQYHFEQLMVRSERPDLDSLLEVFQDSWKSHATARVQFGRREVFDDYCHMADRTLRVFLNSDWAHPQGTIIGIEEELRGHVVPGCPDILGRVDLLVDAGHELVLTDFKTSRNGWSEGHVVDAAPQLLLYNELAQQLTDGRPLRLQFAVMTKTKRPEFTLHGVANDAEQVNRTKRVIQRVWRAIQARQIYPNPSPISCPVCPYRAACRAWQG